MRSPTRARLAAALALALAPASIGAARADDAALRASADAAPALQQVASVPSAAGSGSSVPPPPAHATVQPKPEDQRLFMLMLLSRTSFGAFGQMGQ